jgi:hypothetical protein
MQELVELDSVPGYRHALMTTRTNPEPGSEAEWLQQLAEAEFFAREDERYEQMTDDITAIVKMLAVDNEFTFPDEYSYEQAIALGLVVWQAARGAAAVDVRAEAQHWSSTLVERAFEAAAWAAEHGRSKQ